MVGEVGECAAHPFTKNVRRSEHVASLIGLFGILLALQNGVGCVGHGPAHVHQMDPLCKTWMLDFLHTGI